MLQIRTLLSQWICSSINPSNSIYRKVWRVYCVMMDLLASVQFSNVSQTPGISNRKNVCAVSNKNLVAFSAPKCYKSQRGSGTRSAVGEKSQQSFWDFGGYADTVFVCSLASPWNVHAVTQMEYQIKHIVWDASGTKLLLADTGGQILLWQMHESLINIWTCTNMSKSMLGDDIIALKWINHAHMFTIAKDVREQALYEKKFPLAGVSPSIGYFGGRSVDYWVVVTSSGVVGVGIVQQKTEMVVSKTVLEHYENRRLSCADIVIESDGSIQIVTTTGSTIDPIRLHKLTTDISSHGYLIQPNSFSLDCGGHSCFFVDKCTDVDKINLLCYVQPIGGHTVLVAIDKSHGGTEIQQWTMYEETLDLHTSFHTHPAIPEKNFYWIRQTSVQLPSYVLSASTSPLVTDNTSLFPLGAAFSCDDKTIKLTSRLSLSDLSDTPYYLSQPEDYHLTGLAISPNGCVCVGVTNTCGLLIFGERNLSIEHTCVLLEHSLVTGAGWEDILMCVKPDISVQEKILEALESNFSKQSNGTQMQTKNRLTMLKIGLTSANEVNAGYSADLLTSILLNHARNIFLSILSSTKYDETDQSAEEKFLNALNNSPASGEGEVDSILPLLEPAVDFIPEDNMASTLQPIIQWVCDLSISLLSSLPVYNLTNKTGSWLLRDIQSLVTLRELLLLIRLWYNSTPRLRPILTCSISCDVLAKMFKLLTWLLISVKKREPFSDNLLDECNLLSNQIVLPPFDRSFCWSWLPLQINSKPFEAFHFTFGDEPDSIKCLRLPFGQYVVHGKKDIFSHLEVNSQLKEGFKKCIRCQALTAITRPINDQKTRLSSVPLVPHYCVCGGLWSLAT